METGGCYDYLYSCADKSRARAKPETACGGQDRASEALQERRHRGGGEVQAGVLHALAGGERVGKAAQIAGGTLHEEHLEIVMVLEMDVGRGDDHEIILVLDVGELPLEISFPIVVNEADRAGHRLGAELLRVLDQLLAGHLGDGVGAVGELTTGDHVVELVEEVGGERDAEAGELGAAGGGHGRGVSRRERR